eukprot:220494_1
MSDISLYFLLAICFSIITNAQVSMRVNITSNTITSINNKTKTSRYLLGETAYGDFKILTNATYVTELQKQYGINIMSFVPINSLFYNTNNGFDCCNTTEDLNNYINSGQACRNFAQSPIAKIWESNYWNALTIDSFQYFISCNNMNSVERYHCCDPDVNQQHHIPLYTNAWWVELFKGTIKCVQKVMNKTVKYAHIWNEANAQFQSTCSALKGVNKGQYYADFYYNVTKVMKNYFPSVKISGPVTAGSPAKKSIWEGFYVPLFKKLKNNAATDLIDYIDYHAYTNAHTTQIDSLWDVMVTNLHGVSIYSELFLNKKLATHITETNVKLNITQVPNNETYWKYRAINNSLSILALSHNSDKFGSKLTFDLESPGKICNCIEWDSNDLLFMQTVLKSIQNGYTIKFVLDSNLVSESNKYLPYYYNNHIMVQVVMHNYTDFGTNVRYQVFVVNSGETAVNIMLNDLNNNIKWNGHGEIAKYTGIYDLPMNGGSNFVLDKYSIAMITGNATRQKEYNVVHKLEFIPRNIDVVMLLFNNTQIFNVFIKINAIPSKYGEAKSGELQLGFSECGASNFRYKIEIDHIEIESSFKPSKYYSVIRLANKFVKNITNGHIFDVSIMPHQIEQNETFCNDKNRFVFASIVAEF